MRKMKLQHRTGCCKSEIRRAVQMLGAPLKWTVMLSKWKKTMEKGYKWCLLFKGRGRAIIWTC